MLTSILDRLKAYFPMKAKSFQKFVSKARQEGVREINVSPAILDLDEDASEYTSININNFLYQVLYAGTTASGRKLTYTENLYQRFGSQFGLGDSEFRNIAEKICLRTVIDRQEQLKKNLGRHVNVEIASPDRIWSEEETQEFLNSCLISGVKPVELK
jgi:hypothetical protein